MAFGFYAAKVNENQKKRALNALGIQWPSPDSWIQLLDQDLVNILFQY